MHGSAADLLGSLPEQPARSKLNFYEDSGKPGFSGERRRLRVLHGSQVEGPSGLAGTAVATTMRVATLGAMRLPIPERIGAGASELQEKVILAHG